MRAWPPTWWNRRISSPFTTTRPTRSSSTTRTPEGSGALRHGAGVSRLPAPSGPACAARVSAHEDFLMRPSLRHEVRPSNFCAGLHAGSPEESAHEHHHRIHRHRHRGLRRRRCRRSARGAVGDAGEACLAQGLQQAGGREAARRAGARAVRQGLPQRQELLDPRRDRKSTRLNSSHVSSSYAVFCLKKKITIILPSITIIKLSLLVTFNIAIQSL